MSTATSTLTEAEYSTQILHKGAIPVTTALSSPPTSTTATLRTLYERAAPAFLHRDIPLTQSLIDSAFAVITPPDTIPDGLAEHRRKWDILRITLECLVYSSPSPHDTLPQLLKWNQLQSPQTLLTVFFRRSLNLFSPASEKSNVSSAYLPSQVLITLVYSSLRLDCPDVGRIMIEDWLSRRDVSSSVPQGGEATEGRYQKVLELYCLQILPKLKLWDYAQEFLEYEGELHAPVRESFKTSLKSLQTTAMSSRQSHHAASLSPTVAGSSFRPYSPAPSSSSSSSSLSTTSTNTIVPPTVRGAQHSHATFISSTSTNVSATSLSSNSTATPRPTSRRPVLKSRTPESPSTSNHLSFPTSSPQVAALRSADLNIYALIKASLAPYLSTSNIFTFFLIFIVFPLVSLVLRARHRRRKASGDPVGVHSHVQVVRTKLKGARALGTFKFGEVVRVVRDTVKMAGSGLV